MISKKIGFLMVLERNGVVKDYKRWLKSYMRSARHREVSKNSLVVYKRVLGKLEKYIKKQNDITQIREIDREFFFSFLEYFEKKSKVDKFATKTKTLYIAVLKSFFVYISDNNDELYTYENEFKGMMPQKINKSKKITYLLDSETEVILEYLHERMKNRGGHYDYIYSFGIKLMLFSGLRVSEVLNLKLENIIISELTDTEGVRDFYEIHLLDTKSKEDQITLIKAIHIEVELEYFRQLWSEEEYIFKGKGKIIPINRSNFYVSINKIMEKNSIKGRGLHIFRHTCAMQLFRKTGNLLVLKETLRHSDIKTTMIYAHAQKRDIAEAMR